MFLLVLSDLNLSIDHMRRIVVFASIRPCSLRSVQRRPRFERAELEHRTDRVRGLVADRRVHARSATDFEAANAGVTVTFNFGSSTTSRPQIQSEGTADVFASRERHRDGRRGRGPGRHRRGRTSSTNALVVVTPRDNPAGIESIEDLAEDGVQLVLGAEGVPVGDYAREALDERRHRSTRPRPTSSRTKRTTPASWRRSWPVRPTRRSSTSPTSRRPPRNDLDGLRHPRRRQRDRDLPDRGRRRRRANADLAAGVHRLRDGARAGHARRVRVRPAPG